MSSLFLMSLISDNVILSPHGWHLLIIKSSSKSDSMPQIQPFYVSRESLPTLYSPVVTLNCLIATKNEESGWIIWSEHELNQLHYSWVQNILFLSFFLLSLLWTSYTVWSFFPPKIPMYKHIFLLDMGPHDLLSCILFESFGISSVCLLMAR